jgi:hypothetical protein
MTTHRSFLEVFPSVGRSPEIPPADDLYGWLIGGWNLDVAVYDDTGNVQQTKGEAHFSWVLDGRAVQDVFINPRRSDRVPEPPKVGSNWYGSTVRVYDPAIQAWRITWLNPANGTRAELIGRRQGKDIVQEGKYSGEIPIRWSFTDITPHSFRWLGERLGADSLNWQLQVEFQARRLA